MPCGIVANDKHARSSSGLLREAPLARRQTLGGYQPLSNGQAGGDADQREHGKDPRNRLGAGTGCEPEEQHGSIKANRESKRGDPPIARGEPRIAPSPTEDHPSQTVA
jgi:hypothetical protein